MERYIDVAPVERAWENECIKYAEDTRTENITKLVGISLQILKAQPTADVAPVIHAHWIEETFYDDYGNRFARCSHCGKCEVVWDNYCRECGAKMDEVVKDETLD